MNDAVRTLARDESGGVIVEYALVLALVSLVALGALTSFGDVLLAFFSQTSTTLSDVARQAK